MGPPGSLGPGRRGLGALRPCENHFHPVPDVTHYPQQPIGIAIVKPKRQQESVSVICVFFGILPVAFLLFDVLVLSSLPSSGGTFLPLEAFFLPQPLVWSLPRR